MGWTPKLRASRTPLSQICHSHMRHIDLVKVVIEIKIERCLIHCIISLAASVFPAPDSPLHVCKMMCHTHIKSLYKPDNNTLVLVVIFHTAVGLLCQRKDVCIIKEIKSSIGVV